MSLEIELKNVALRFPKPDGCGCLTVYEGFNLEVEQGSFTVLLGPSGCGKSTLLNVINGLLRPSEVDVLNVFGKDLRQNPDLTRRMAYVFQSPRLLKWKTLRGNVVFGLRGLGVQPKEKWDELMDRYFGIVGLSDYVNYYPHQVSGGMQQRAAIVRAWVNEPRILLMDEPFSHLDEISAGELRRELIKLWSQEQPRRTIIFVTHDLSEAIHLGENILMLTKCPAQVFHAEKIDIPWPRLEGDDRIFELEKRLRRMFFEQVGIQV
ncbi:MAG: ATP-binding cassette domain-containing protein [Chloroflexota bacterium]|nr:ATP-binding cassette domain-containing protein [Chloroflexota bacterium]